MVDCQPQKSSFRVTFFLTLMAFLGWNTALAIPENFKTSEPPVYDVFDLYSPDEIYQRMLKEYGPPDVTATDKETAPTIKDIDDHLRYTDINVFESFPMVVVINKSNTGKTKQTMNIYVYGQKWYTWLVSTGREQWETPKKGGRYFSSTPVGWFSPTWITEMHRSGTWDADMPFSVFFNGGIAVHAANPAYYDRLGSRASGGCVRLRRDQAKLFFDMVSFFGKGDVPQFTQEGKAFRLPDGSIKMKKDWRTLIIVEDEVK